MLGCAEVVLVRNDRTNRARYCMDPADDLDTQIAHGGHPNLRRSSSAFRGQTPDEMYFGTGESIPDEIAAGKQSVRESRLEANLATSCPACEPPELTANCPKHAGRSGIQSHGEVRVVPIVASELMLRSDAIASLTGPAQRSQLDLACVHLKWRELAHETAGCRDRQHGCLLR